MGDLLILENIKKTMPVTLAICGVMAVVQVLSTALPTGWTIRYLSLSPTNIFNPLKWYRFFTFHFVNYDIGQLFTSVFHSHPIEHLEQ
jgi:hypothetical protein